MKEEGVKDESVTLAWLSGERALERRSERFRLFSFLPIRSLVQSFLLLYHRFPTIIMPLHADLLTRLRNASLARLRQVPIPYTTSNLSILSILLQQGLIHSISKGTISTPSNPSEFRQASIPSKRLWVTLKYTTQDTPVLSTLDLISKPSKKVFMNREELLRFISYRRSQFVQPLAMGEIGIVNAGKQGWFEAREAVLRKVQGGEVVARAG